MNLPNKITLARFLAAILLTILFSIFGSTSTIMYVLFSIFVLSSISDAVDGAIARKTGQVTGFGKLFDPLADKVLTISVALILYEVKLIPFFWMSLVMIIRELFVLGIRLGVLEGQGEAQGANALGKAKTGFQMVSMSILLLSSALAFSFEGSAFLNVFILVGQILFYISLVLCVVSGFVYYIKNCKYFKMK